MAYYKEYEVEREIPSSKYNAAISQIYRLDKLWKMCHGFAISGNFLKWHWTLDRVWVELSPDSEPKDKKIIGIIRRRISKVLQKAPDLRKAEEETNEKEKIRKIRKILYRLLMGYEIALRETQNSQGKGTAYREEGEEGVD